MEKLELNINYEYSDNELIKKMATESVENGDYLNWDHAYESLWNWFEEEINYKGCLHSNTLVEEE